MYLLVNNGETLLIRRRVDKPSGAALPHAQLVAHLVGTIDITYIRLVAGWMYLVAVLDLYARYVVSWALDDTLEQPFVLDAVSRALAQATPQIWNSDQCSHFTSPQYTGLLDAAGVQISMDGKG